MGVAALVFALGATHAAAAPTIEGCPVFPANNVWNARVDQLPVHANSAAWIANVAIGGNGATRGFHMDFGSGLYPDPPDPNAAPIGIPYVVVNGTQPKVPVNFDDGYPSESDPGPYPIPPNAPIEGVGPANAVGDRHVLVIDRDACILYETYNSAPVSGGASWTADSGAVYDLNSNGPLRTSGWTSADAAGLPIFPGLARYEEVAAGVIEHALRFTAQRTQTAFIWPARHQAGHTSDVNFPPMGARFRLKANYDITGFSLQARVIAQAMKTYGIMLADNGSPWYVSGIPDPGWDNDVLHELDVLRGGDFEAVDTSSLMVHPDSGQFQLPQHALSVTKTGANAASGTVTSAPAAISCGATCEASFDSGSSVTLTATKPGGTAFAGWSGDCTGSAACNLTMDRAHSVGAAFVPVQEKFVLTPDDTLDLGTYTMGIASSQVPVTATNIGTSQHPFLSFTLTGSDAFSGVHGCGINVAAGQSCLVYVTFTPPLTAGALNATQQYQTTVSLVSYGGNLVVTATGEKSLVPHFYRSILGRAPEAGGHNFWRSEAGRLAALGANVNETWFVLANYFFNSPEYIAANKTDTQFLTDLYNTFFNRPPDGGGMAYWQSQMDAGLSREGVIFWFMFSNEFRTFTQGIFGSTAARPEVDMVMDLFRGILNRLPDTTAFNAFVGTLRSAQCQGAGQVYTAVNDMSYFFLFGSPEYAGRARTNSQYVSDMYNAFLRRGGADSEVDFWINQLDTSAKDRNTVRADFMASPEFGARVNAVVAAGCMP